MNEAEGLNFSVGVPSDRGEPSRKKPKAPGFRHNNPGLDDIILFINGLSITKGDKDTLVRAARRTPHGALSNFRSNYLLYLKKEGRR